jgi:hypothetical protein
VAAALASRPRTPLRQAGPPTAHTPPRIETLTLNGFQILHEGPRDPAAAEHRFHVKHFPDGAEFTVTVAIDAEAVARVARLSRHPLSPGGAFWREQAERLLSAFLWSEGKAPADGRLTVHDVSREDLDVAAAWTAD